MLTADHGRQAIKRILFGDNLQPERVFLTLTEPQREIAVWLHGMGQPIDVTRRHTLASAAPLTFCISFEKGTKPNGSALRGLSLKFCRQNDRQQVLGEIGLQATSSVPAADSELTLFEAQNCSNYCLPTARLWADRLVHERSQRQRSNSSDLPMSSLERHAMEVMFICPRPVSLISAAVDIRENMFPMAMLGDLDNGYFAFSLKFDKLPARLVEQAGKIALSNIPSPQAALAYRLAADQIKKDNGWYQLPFETTMSPVLKIPVPTFAYRVREVEVEQVRRIGNQSFFVGRVVHDQSLTHGDEMFVIHGFYQAWRIRNRVALDLLPTDDEPVTGAKFEAPPRP